MFILPPDSDLSFFKEIYIMIIFSYFKFFQVRGIIIFLNIMSLFGLRNEIKLSV